MTTSHEDIRVYVVRPSQMRIGLWDQASENLVFGTGLVESGYQAIDQVTPGPGPAYGFWQMEEKTYADIWTKYLPSQPSALRDSLIVMSGLMVSKGAFPPVTVLHWNLLYAAAMCRIHYRRVRAALPAAGDAYAMAQYYKTYYNTPLGAATLERALPFFRQAVNS